MFGSRFGSKQSHDNSGPSRPTHDSKNDSGFMRLHGKPSQNSMTEDLEHGMTALPDARHVRQDRWREIHVTKDFEQRSVNEGRSSDDSQKDLYTHFGRHTSRR